LVAGQDVEAVEDGVFRVARTVARDRLISTVDVQARHGHKSRARTFDGYKTHLNVDPDDELITNVAVTAVNTADRGVIDELLNEPGAEQPATDAEPATDGPGADADTDTGTDGGSGSKHFEVYGDSAYADGATLHEQTQRGHDMRTKAPPGTQRQRLLQGPVPHRPGRRHRHLPGTAHRDHPQRPPSFGPLRATMSILPATGGLHESPWRAGDQHPPP
jgi:Transposase DDE domain